MKKYYKLIVSLSFLIFLLLVLYAVNFYQSAIIVPENTNIEPLLFEEKGSLLRDIQMFCISIILIYLLWWFI